MTKSCRCNLTSNSISAFESLLFYQESTYIFLILFLCILVLLQCHMNIELNPGPKKLKKNSLSVCYWNLNSLPAHNFSKLTQLKTYISMYKHDFICLSQLFSLTSSNGFSQLIKEPTYIQSSSSSCIDLAFTDQPNLSVNSGVHASLHPNFHHPIVHSSFNLDISYHHHPHTHTNTHTHTHTRTQTPYQKLIWDYKKADLKNIRKVFDLVNWERLFGQKDINVQVAPFNETILNVFRDYVPNKYITSKKCALKTCLQN